MEKCRPILKDIMNKDLQKIFAVPVDPVALNIPTYFDIIEEPMDLGTIHSQLESGDLDSPEEFIRLVRLVFENAIKFNTMPDSYVHVTARSLLTLFNSKIRNVETVLGHTKNKKLSKAELAEIKRKEKEAKKKGKRKGFDEGGSDHKRMKLSEFIFESKTLEDSISQATSQAHGDSVSRAEFNQLLQLIQLQRDHIVSLHKMVTKSSSSTSSPMKNSSQTTSVIYEIETKSSPKKKKQKTEKKAKLPPPSPEYFPKQSPVENLEPLTIEEQQTLSEDINNLPDHLMYGAMEIIRDAGGVNDEDDEIDLDLDMLDIKTQRRLLSYISEVRCAVAPILWRHAYLVFLSLLSY
jgi:hypothetical protein